MNFSNVFAIPLILLLFYSNDVKSQQAVLTSGGEAQLGIGSVSIGQVFYTYHSGTDGDVIFGVQQPFDDKKGRGHESKALIKDGLTQGLDIKVYPNPSSTNSTLVVNSDNYTSYSYRIIDPMGSVIQRSSITSTETQINLYMLPSGVYFIQIFENHQLLKNLKLIKL